jgi:hypothetical protein
VFHDLRARVRLSTAIEDASVMMAFSGSFGSSSPNARPASVSYWPAAPNVAPSKAGDTFFSMTIFLTSAWTAVAAVSTAATANPH